jgi:hypothetical protein
MNTSYRTASIPDVASAVAVAAGVGALLVAPVDAWAYLDPGTGSFVLQMAAAGFFAAMVTLRQYMAYIKAWFKGGSAKKDDQAP